MVREENYTPMLDRLVTESGVVALIKFVAGVAVEQATLARSRCPNNNSLEGLILHYMDYHCGRLESIAIRRGRWCVLVGPHC